MIPPHSETWRIVRGWSRYEVSDLGRVRNRLTGQVLKPFPVVSRRNSVYWRVSLYKRVGGRSVKRDVLVHRIVAFAFVERPPEWEEHWHVDHVDTDPDNNSAANLRRVTPRHNYWLRDNAGGDGAAAYVEYAEEQEAPF